MRDRSSEPDSARPRGALVLGVIDRVSSWAGKFFAWLIVLLTLAVGIEVVKRYVLNAPTAWMFDAQSILYGTLLMMCGAYALAHAAHVRADFVYSRLRPRAQAAADLALYLLFFLPGVLALVYAGYEHAMDSWTIREHSTSTADGPPIYHFKTVIPIAGALLLLQGFGEILRCIFCLRDGTWPARIGDVEEIDVVESQLSDSKYVDAESRQAAIEARHAIETSAHHRSVHDDEESER